MQGTLTWAVVGTQPTKPHVGWYVDPSGIKTKMHIPSQYQKEVNLATYGAMYTSSLYGPRIHLAQVKSGVGKPLWLRVSVIIKFDPGI